MASYLLRRFNLLVLTALAMLALLYIATRALPGDPVTNLSGIQLPTAEQVVQIRDDYALDKGWIRGYFAFIGHRLSGDFGLSISSGNPVSDELWQRLPATGELVILASLLALAIGVPLGIFASGRRGPLPRLIWAGTVFSFSMPVFWLGMLLILLLGLQLDWLPASGRLNMLYDVPRLSGLLLLDIPLSNMAAKEAALRDALAHLVLPLMVLITMPTTIIIRTIRLAMRAEMDKNYIQALSARGISHRRLVLFHALPNAMAPMFRTLALMIGPLASATIMVEYIFTWPGIGRALLLAFQQQDYPLLLGGILVISLFIITIGIGMEVIQALLSPASRKEHYA